MSPAPAHFFDFEHAKYSLEELRQMIHEEVHNAAASDYSRAHLQYAAATSTSSTTASSADHQTAKTTQSTTNENAYSNHGSNNNHAEEPHRYQQQHQLPQQTYPRASSAAASGPSGYDGSGPVSQLATQVRHNNPFANNGSSNTSNARAQHQQQQQQQVVAEARQQIASYLSSNHTSASTGTGNEGAHSTSHGGNNSNNNSNNNILSVVRNGVQSAQGVLPGSRSTAPKTPTPQKMDLILQKDLALRQRFQQVGV